jgi:hypothetical protein
VPIVATKARWRAADEEAEAKAQGLPYALVPRELSREEWIEKYSPKQDGESR